MRSKNELCIDVDLTEPEKHDPIGIARAFHEFSYLIKRRVVLTRHGIHIYLSIPTLRWREDKDFYLYLCRRYGDDPLRVAMDELRWGHTRVNVCFSSTEVIA